MTASSYVFLWDKELDAADGEAARELSEEDEEAPRAWEELRKEEKHAHNVVHALYERLVETTASDRRRA